MLWPRSVWKPIITHLEHALTRFVSVWTGKFRSFLPLSVQSWQNLGPVELVPELAKDGPSDRWNVNALAKFHACDEAGNL